MRNQITYKVTILASGISQYVSSPSEAEYWAEVVKGLGKSSYKVEKCEFSQLIEKTGHAILREFRKDLEGNL